MDGLARPTCTHDWEQRRATIEALYWEQDKDLPEVMDIMRVVHNFTATKKQYKNQFKVWHLEKNVKTDEMKTMIRIQDRRRLIEGKDTQFLLRKRLVPREKIQRFMKRQKTTPVDNPSPSLILTAPTPSEIEYSTPIAEHDIPSPPATHPMHLYGPVISDNVAAAPAALGTVESIHSSVEAEAYDSEILSSELEQIALAANENMNGVRSLSVCSSGSTCSLSNQSTMVNGELADQLCGVHFAGFSGRAVGRTGAQEISLHTVSKPSDGGGQLERIGHDSLEMAGVSPASQTDCPEVLMDDSDSDSIVEVTRDEFSSCMDASLRVISSVEFSSVVALKEAHSAVETQPTPEKMLRLAARRGDITKLRLLLARGVNPNSYSEKGMTALHLAAYQGHDVVVILLLEHGAKPDLPITGDIDMAGFCGYRRSGKQTVYGLTALHLSASSGNVNTLRALLAGSATVESRSPSLETPLHRASAHGWEEIAELLLSSGANVNAIRDDGTTPLHLAAICDHEPVARILLKHGAQVDALRSDGSTPLHITCRVGSADTVFLLRCYGADMNRRQGNAGYTPLHFAMSCGHTDIFWNLLQDCRYPNSSLLPAANPTLMDNLGCTPLHLAAQMRDREMAEMLLDHGAYIHPMNSDGYTPLHLAARGTDVNVVRLLLDHGADPNYRGWVQTTPIHRPAMSGSSRAGLVIKLLAEAGSSMNEKDEWDLTPLHEAVVRNNASSVSMLLSCGADQAVVETSGRTPLEAAVLLKRTALVQHFVRHCVGQCMARCQCYASMRVLNDDPTDYYTFGQHPRLRANFTEQDTLPVIRAIMEHEACHSDESQDGESFLQWALKQGYSHLSNLAIQVGNQDTSMSRL